MTIEKRIERIEAILDAKGLDWDHPRVEDEPLPVDFGDKDHPVVMRQTMVFSLSQSDKNQPVKEPPKKWRILEPGEIVQDGDWINARVNLQEDSPPDGGWLPAPSFYFGKEASADFGLFFARPVGDEPAKEPVHPADPKPDPGKGYRPVDDGDIGKIVEVQNSLADPWRECTLLAIDWDRPFGFLCRHSDPLVALRWRFARIKTDEPANEPEPEHLAGPMPDPGDGYRILSKDPPEDLTPGDEFEDVNGEWIRSSNAETDKKQGATCWYRRKIEQPTEPQAAWEPKVGDWVKVTRPERPEISDDTPWLAEMDRFDGKVMQVARFWEIYKSLAVILAGTNFAFKVDWLAPADAPANELVPSWEPKVGDWVKVTRPKNWEKCWSPCWLAEMHQFDGKVGCIERGQGSYRRIRGFVGSDGLPYQFHRDWLTPAEPPAIDKPAEPEYREPVLPADAGKYCQFSDDGIEWRTGWLNGWVQRSHQWVSHSGGHWLHCRIKVDA